jgi:truncated hemoglobin YjbI
MRCMLLISGSVVLLSSVAQAQVSSNCPTARRAYVSSPRVVSRPAAPRVVAKPATKSLYDRLGGQKAITAVIDDFVSRAATDEKVNFFRKGTDREWKPSDKEVAMLKTHLVNLVGMLTGGPQKYTGRDMKSSHAGMKITDAEFDALAGDLKASLDHFKVPMTEQQELLTIVGSTRGDIVEKSLFERLGGEKAIRAVVDDFVGRLAANEKVNVFRKGTAKEWKPTDRQVAVLKEHLVDLIGEVTGGPNVYTGRDMKTAHAGMKISAEEFDASAADLKATLDHFKVPVAEQQELLTIIASTKAQIVEK